MSPSTPTAPMGGASSPPMGDFSSTHNFFGHADVAAQACQLSPALMKQVQMIGSRIQKLERSRGQISKDITDMLGETQQLRQQMGIEATLAEEPPRPRAAEAATAAEEAALPPGLLGAARKAAAPREPEQPVLSKAQSDKIGPPPGLGPPPAVAAEGPPADTARADSLVVRRKDLVGKAVSRVEWRIDNVKTKFKDCVGRPLVSPQFEAEGLDELRLMVFPDLGLHVSGLTMREQKQRYEARIAEGPLSGSLKFKVITGSSEDLVVKFNLFVGSACHGPLEHNFADHIIHGVDFDGDWLDYMKNGSLTVGVEVLEVSRGAAAKAST